MSQQDAFYALLSSDRMHQTFRDGPGSRLARQGVNQMYCLSRKTIGPVVIQKSKPTQKAKSSIRKASLSAVMGVLRPNSRRTSSPVTRIILRKRCVTRWQTHIPHCIALSDHQAWTLIRKIASGSKGLVCKPLKGLVELKGFEPSTP